MPVGAGSIKRAAKTGVKAAEKSVAEKNVAQKQAAEKSVAEKVTVEAAAKKKGTKAAGSSAEPVMNEVCHLTEELPIHLL